MNEDVPENHSDGFGEASQSLYEYSDNYFSDNTIVLSKSRNGQNIFRKIVLASYNEACAISGITDKRVLVASHIAPWASHETRRLDPRNGICLNALWDKAFDRGLISFSDSFEILYSNDITQNDHEIFSSMSPKFRPPEKFQPDCELLEAHRKKFGFNNQK
jgi:putative restriction endonuclease